MQPQEEGNPGLLVDSQLIEYDTFRDIVRERSRELLKVAAGCVGRRPGGVNLTRPLLGVVLAESSQLEELLDAFGARNNRKWHVFRMRIAALKNFSEAGYELLHLAHAAEGYNLINCCPSFPDVTQDAIDYVSCLILCSLQDWYREAQSLGIGVMVEGIHVEDYREDLPSGRLPRDRKDTHRETVESRILALATQFLHGTERAKFLRGVTKIDRKNHRDLIGDPLSEERLRGLEVRFHNLQSLYDTYVSDSDTETLDEQLPSLRGHISAVLHLLRVATIFVHFYERHIMLNPDVLFCQANCPLREDGFFRVLIDYCIDYSYQFLQDARRICREMIKRYAEVDSIEVAVPKYHGFHVRPSTLVASIVGHYGCDVTMSCGETTYNAGAAMELFRANEWINRQKRERIHQRLSALPLDEIEQEAGSKLEAVREVLIRLAEERTIVIHEHPLPLRKMVQKKDAPLLELLRASIAFLLHERKINIESDITVMFTGDKRVLADLRTLAESGYGEDESGNNIPLPPALGYLRHSRNM